MILFILINIFLSNEIDTNNIKKHFKIYKDDNYSYYFYDYTNKKEVISHNKDKKFSLASVSKLFVTGASIDILGIDFRFKTKIYSDDNNNIYIKGGGDPVFVSETMWYLVNELVNWGYIEINNIYLDTSLFDEIKYSYSENDRAYSAIISPLLVNFNSIAVNINSGKNNLIKLDPDLDLYKTIDKTNKTNKATNVSLRRQGNNFVIEGNINKLNIANKKIYRNIEEPINNFAKTLALHLKWRDIKLKGKILNLKTPANAKELFAIDSKRLVDLLVDMNKFSSNLIAEQLLLAIANKSIENKIDKSTGIKLIYDHFKKLNLNLASVNLENASGLSPNNKASSEFVVAYLSKIISDINLAPEFISSLSISGTDGTIKSTMSNNNIKGIVRAKTGSLNNVRTIAGVLNLKDKVYLFAILVNGARANEFLYTEEKVLLEFIK